MPQLPLYWSAVVGGLSSGEIKAHTRHKWVAVERVALTLNYKELQEFSIRRRDDGVNQLCARWAHNFRDQLEESNRKGQSFLQSKGIPKMRFKITPFLYFIY
jgi:hypothetical protein